MTVYSPTFYEQQQEGSLRSARRVLPHLVQLVAPRSLVDVGCGVGTWLKAAMELGVEDVLGIDGPYVDRAMLQIPASRFTPIDLTRPFRLPRTFDVALSLEVAEHLPESYAADFVESLASLSNIVLFSAAIPKQMGEHHINEQWQSWWVDRFAAVGFVPVDCMRRRVWDDADVEWWYAQNMLLMVRSHHLRAVPALKQEYERAPGPYAVVHPRAYLDRLAAAERSRPRGAREWLALGPELIAATLRRVVGRADKT